MKYLYCAALALLVLSCKKKSDAIDTTTPSADQLLGTYKQTAEAVNNTNTWTTVNNQHMACEMDDTYTLNGNTTYTYTDAGTTCSSTGNYTGTWSVSGDRFIMDGDTSTIVNFNGSELKLRSTERFGSMTYVTESTFSRQ